MFPESPETVAPAQEPLNWRNIGAWGCLVWMIVYFVGGFLFLAFLMVADLTDNPTLRSMADWWLLPSAILSFAATIVFMRWKSAQETRKLHQRESEATRQAKEAEANSLTADLLKIRQSSQQLATQIPQRLHDADAWLRSAEDRWNENVPNLFWEAVQNSTAHLVHFCAVSQELAGTAERYYGALRGRRHTFPPVPVHLAELPNPTPVVEKLQSIVHRGQTHASFGTMWEQYKTHHIPVSGFSTLEQAINDLPEAAGGATSLLKRAIVIERKTA